MNKVNYQSGVQALSVIVPFRADPNTPYLITRLEEQCQSFLRHDAIEFIVVDSGSALESRKACVNICTRYGVSYLYHDSEGQTFSIGAARDYGVCHANGRAITFLDVDLRVADDFWDRLLLLMASFGISSNKKQFFVVPCLYLTQEGTEEFITANTRTRALDFYLRWLEGDNQSVQTMAPCSSVMVVDRLHYLSVGGHRPEFRGHGYEDFELYHRLIGEEGVLPRAVDYYHDAKSWDTSTYRGFRAQFSVLGRHALMANLFVVHLWHPRPKTSSFYGNMSANRKIWMDFFREFDNTQEHPEPLVASEAQYKKFLFFGKPYTNAVRCLRDITPLLGRPLYVSEYDFMDDEGQMLEADFASLIQQHGIEAIVFPNPYGNSSRLKIYHWCRRTKFPYLCFERGALADSWFFDANGFNADSTSYSMLNWRHQLTPTQRDETIEYIRLSLAGASTLEKQGDRVSGEGLAARLNTGGKRVLFVPLQRPSDTVIRYFAGELESYEAFLRFIDQAAQELKRQGWVVLCKKHPLETEILPLQHAQYVPEDTHFIDLLELADAVALINSGVGVYAMMAGKPCFIFGEAFYAFEGINQRASAADPKDFCRQLRELFRVDMEDVYRFIHFLKNSFYSFGVSRNKMRKESDGSLRNITTGIDFYEIRIPSRPPVLYAPQGRPQLATAAPLFERFRLDLVQRKLAKLAASASVKRSPPVVKDPKSKRAAKWRKLRLDPHAFFRDAKQPALRALRFLFLRK